MFKRWIYHATKAPKIINDGEFEQYEALGWADTPAVFMKLEVLGINQDKIKDGDEEETAKAQQAFDAVEGVRDSLNGALNLEDMNKNELEAYAKDHFSIDIDRRKNKRSLLKEIKALIN